MSLVVTCALMRYFKHCVAGNEVMKQKAADVDSPLAHRFSARPWQLCDKRVHAGGAFAFSLFYHLITEPSEYCGCSEHGWHPTGSQLTHRNFEGFRHSRALLGAFEGPCPARTPVVTELTHGRELVLRKVGKRLSTPAADCRPPATNAMSTTPDAVPACGRTDQGAIVHHFPCVAALANDPLHGTPVAIAVLRDTNDWNPDALFASALLSQ